MAIFPLTNNNFGDYNPQIADRNLVWSGFDGNDEELYLYNYDNGSVVQLTDNDTYESNPRISGNNVVWSSYDGNDSEIYFYDGSQTVQLTDNDTSDSSPQISGNNIVWANYGSGYYEDSQIYFYDGSQTIQLADNGFYDASPQISGNNVVWSGYDGKDSEIYLYNGSNVIKLTTNATNDYNPQISGNNVVWSGYDGNDNEIYFYDGSQTIQLTDNDTYDSNPQISGNNVVWSGYDGNDSEIYFYDGSQTIQLTDNDTSDSNPQISGNNVVWSGYDGNDDEIYLNFSPLLIPGEIRGSKWQDFNGNGQRDGDEPGIEGWTIYLDQNQNAQLDPGEISTLTDANGFYSFSDLRFGTYTVAEVPDSRWQQTYPLAVEYEWSDNSNANGPNFNWIDISDLGIEVSLGDDDQVEVALPFDFVFYGQTQNSIRISSNGYLTFDTDGTSYYNSTIPSSYDVNNLIAPFWDDLNPDFGGSIYYYNDVAAERFIVQYQDVPRYEVEGSLTFQTILNSDGSILFQYDDLNATLDSATVGLENADGTSGVQVAYNQSYLNNDLAINFVSVSNPLITEAHQVFVGTGEIVEDINFGNRLRQLRIEAEDYNEYFDTTPGNSGGAYRDDDVDIEATTDIGGGFNVGWTDQGEWLTYDVDLPEDGFYQIVARVASDLDDRSHRLDITLDGQTTSVSFNSTDGWQSWIDVSGGNLNLTAGSHELRLDMGSLGFNVNYIDLLPVAGIRVEAEDYQTYFDTTEGNTGGAYRDDDVDLEATTDIGGGFNVGWIDQGEWLTYDVDIPESGSYQLTARVASDFDTPHSLTVSLDGQTSTFSFDGTGGWQSWEDVIGDSMNLSAGSHELRIDMGNGPFNVNYIDLVSANDPAVGISDALVADFV